MSSGVERAPRALLFDLFATLVDIDPARLPREQVGGRERVQTIRALEEVLAPLRPRPSVETFLTAAWDMAREVSRIKEETLREVSSQQRFLRTLEALELEGPLEELAEELASRHMDGLAGAVVFAPGRLDLLRQLGRSYRVGLVSNFDHGATARRILERTGLAPLLEAVAISDEVGVRKPAAEIFTWVCARLEVEPADALHVGDCPRADVAGAAAAGLQAVWIRGQPPAPPAAVGVIEQVEELPDWLRRRFGQQAGEGCDG